MTPLSPRMISIAELVVKGYSDKKIAATLGLTPFTVKAYVQRTGNRIGGEGRPRARIFRWWYTSHVIQSTQSA